MLPAMPGHFVGLKSHCAHMPSGTADRQQAFSQQSGQHVVTCNSMAAAFHQKRLMAHVMVCAVPLNSVIQVTEYVR